MPLKSKSIIAELPRPEIVSAEEVFRAYKDGSVELICVLGPTASGKTRYAVRLAREINALAGRPVCEILSADSRQVYRGMDIGTGKDLSEYGDIPYHLIDIEAPGGQYNVHRFQEDFRKACDGIRARGGVPILCGGTGLYINAVTTAYDFDGSRPLSEVKSQGKTFFIGTLVSREVRNARIDARLDARLAEGMVEEIRSLLDGTSPACGGRGPVPEEVLLAYGLEYKFVTLYLKGELSRGEMRDRLAIAIHQFAKRQMTWFRGMERSGAVIHWVEV